MRCTIFLAIFCFYLCSTLQVSAQGKLYVGKINLDGSPASDASNNCRMESTPCLTIQHAIDTSCPKGDACNIFVGDGIYTESIAVNHYRVVAINGNCSNRAATVLSATGPSAAIAQAQDFAIMTFDCFRFTSNYSGVTAIGGAKHVLIDYSNIDFMDTLDGNIVSISDNSIANCTGPISLLGRAANFLIAETNSILRTGCQIHVTSQVWSGAFWTAQWGARIIGNTASIHGPGTGKNSIGIQCIAQDATILIPYDGLPGTSDCQIYDRGVVHP
jgi:hypothetical protein